MPFREPASDDSDSGSTIDVVRAADGYRLQVIGDGPLPEERSCSNCRHLVGYVTWWCGLKQLPSFRLAYCDQYEEPPRRPRRSWFARLLLGDS